VYAQFVLFSFHFAVKEWKEDDAYRVEVDQVGSYIFLAIRDHGMYVVYI